MTEPTAETRPCECGHAMAVLPRGGRMCVNDGCRKRGLVLKSEPRPTPAPPATTGPDLDAKTLSVNEVNQMLAYAFNAMHSRAAASSPPSGEIGAQDAHAAASDIEFMLSGGIVSSETWRGHIAALRASPTPETNET